jgi:hypothetical protein
MAGWRYMHRIRPVHPHQPHPTHTKHETELCIQTHKLSTEWSIHGRFRKITAVVPELIMSWQFPHDTHIPAPKYGSNVYYEMFPEVIKKSWHVGYWKSSAQKLSLYLEQLNLFRKSAVFTWPENIILKVSLLLYVKDKCFFVYVTFFRMHTVKWDDGLQLYVANARIVVVAYSMTRNFPKA